MGLLSSLMSKIFSHPGTTVALMDEAKKKGWIVISMKDDWKTIFPPAETKQ